MSKRLILIMAIALVSAGPARAARLQLLAPIEHGPTLIYQCYPGNSQMTNLGYAGCDGLRGDVTASVPGILRIIPGPDWSNYIGAARSGVPYFVKNVVLTKIPAASIQCPTQFPATEVYQHGTDDIWLWWPLMYETPGTTWKLSIFYGTPYLWDDDGPGPNPLSYVHQEIWRWEVAATAESMLCLLDLFHQMPFGIAEVPLVSNETLYPALKADMLALKQALDDNRLWDAHDILDELNSDIKDACRNVPPLTGPDPEGLEMGIANTPENPACCKLMTDAEYLGRTLHFWQPAK